MPISLYVKTNLTEKLLELSLAFIFLALPSFSSAQDSVSFTRRIFFEAGGNGGLYSINYEKDVAKISSGALKWEAGLSVVPIGKRVVIDFPLSVNYILGKKKHKAEFGTGQLLIINVGDGSGGFIRGTFHLGYRCQPTGKRWFWKLAYTPFYSYASNVQYEHWWGGGIGYQLK